MWLDGQIAAETKQGAAGFREEEEKEREDARRKMWPGLIQHPIGPALADRPVGLELAD